MRNILFSLVSSVLVFNCSQVLAMTACPEIIGEFKTCHVELSPDPSLESKYENVRILVRPDNFFKIEMTVDGELNHAEGVADGQPVKNSEGELTPSCTSTELILDQVEDIEGVEAKTSHRFQLKDQKLHIEQSFFDQVWQTTVCE